MPPIVKDLSSSFLFFAGKFGLFQIHHSALDAESLSKADFTRKIAGIEPDHCLWRIKGR